MNKVTVFKGTINGNEFDTVEAYNAYMNELISNGITDIQACSSTSIKCVDDVATSGYVSTCTDDKCLEKCNAVSTKASTELPEEDPDLSYMPYMEQDDPYYLDLLITGFEDENIEAYNEAKNVLDKCWHYIADALDSNDISRSDKLEYLSTIRNVVRKIKRDNTYTVDALNNIKAKKNELTKDFENYKKNYEDEMMFLTRDEDVLNDSLKIISLFDEFYNNVESYGLSSINENKKCKNCGRPKDECTCDHEVVETSCKEKSPTVVKDLESIIERIFGSCGLTNYRN